MLSFGPQTPRGEGPVLGERQGDPFETMTNGSNRGSKGG